MKLLNEPYEHEQNELLTTNEIEVSSSLFKKIYKFTEFHYGDISKTFIYITIEIEFYENNNENKNENNDNYSDNDDNNSIYTNISIDTDARSTCFQHTDADVLNGVNINADACSVKTTDSHSTTSKNRKNGKGGINKNINKNIR